MSNTTTETPGSATPQRYGPHWLHSDGWYRLVPPKDNVRRLVRYNTDSEDPLDYCEECRDTGWGGDVGPGWSGNNEVGPCACDEQKRARRNIARRNATP